MANQPVNLYDANAVPIPLGQSNEAGSLPVTIASDQSPVATTNSNIDVLLSTRASEATLASRVADATITARFNPLGQHNMAGSAPVVIASDQSAIPVTAVPVTSSTSSVTSVAASAVNVTLLAANASRKGAIFTNDGNKTLYIKLGAGASTSSYSYSLGAQQAVALQELFPGWTGEVDGIWSSANGNARITEIT